MSVFPPKQRYAALVLIAPDGRVVLQRSTSGIATPDYAHSWKCTLFNAIDMAKSATETLDRYSRVSLGLKLLPKYKAEMRCVHSDTIGPGIYMNMFVLEIKDRLILAPDRTEIRLVSCKRFIEEFKEHHRTFFFRTEPVVDVLKQLVISEQ